MSTFSNFAPSGLLQILDGRDPGRAPPRRAVVPWAIESRPVGAAYRTTKLPTPQECSNMPRSNRREFLRDLGLGAAALPFVLNLPSLGFANQTRRKQRLVVMFTPNDVVPGQFWPKEEGAKFTLPESLAPLTPFQDRTLLLN